MTFRSSRPEVFLVKDVLKICSKFTRQQPCRITLWHGCSPVSLLHIFRTLFSKNTSQWLLLDIGEKVIQRCRSFFFVIGTVAIFCKSYYYIRNNFIWQQRFHYIPTFLIITNVFFIKVRKLFSLTFSQNCST